MSNISDQLLELINFSLRGEELYAVIGEVIRVSEDSRTCTVKPADGTPNILGVNLQSVISGASGLVQIPAVSTETEKSYAVVNFISPNSAYAVLFNRIDKILIDTDLVQFNGGSLGGLIKIDDLVDKINGLENSLNGLINNFNLHTHSVPQAPSGATVSATALPQDTNTIAPITTKTDLEDTKVTH